MPARVLGGCCDPSAALRVVGVLDPVEACVDVVHAVSRPGKPPRQKVLEEELGRITVLDKESCYPMAVGVRVSRLRPTLAPAGSPGLRAVDGVNLCETVECRLLGSRQTRTLSRRGRSWVRGGARPPTP
jgi:hypothetical protein